jgi:hypothetical protein
MINSIYKLKKTFRNDYKPVYLKQKKTMKYYFENVAPPTYSKRILIVIELLKQLTELIDNAIFDNIYNQVQSINEIFNFTDNYTFIDTSIKNYNLTKIINDIKILFPNLEKVYGSDKLIFDNSLHLIIGGMIVNILVWDDVQSLIWNNYYNNEFVGGPFNRHFNNYLFKLKEYNYRKEMILELNNHQFYFKEKLNLILVIYILLDTSSTITISELYHMIK